MKWRVNEESQTLLATKHSLFKTRPGDLSSGMRATPGNTLNLILLAGALGAGCGKKENTETNNPGAANPPVTETPKPPPIKPEVTHKSKPPPPTAPVAPKPLSPALVAAWENAGFRAGWMGLHKRTGVHMFSENLEDLDSSKAVPAYKTRIWKTGILGSLPAPTMAFGLGLSLNNQITDAALKEVVKLQHLTSLFLGGTQVADAGLKEVAKLQKLKLLNLRRTQITDVSLKEVAKMQQLEKLLLFGAKTTDEAVAELRKALPNCHIEGP